MIESPRIHRIADGFGLNPEINRTLLHAFRSGKITGASLLLGQSGTDEAISIAKDHPNLAIGYHLDLLQYRPLTAKCWPWNPSLSSLERHLRLSHVSRAFALNELQKQWKTFRNSGLQAQFINSTRHAHYFSSWIRKQLSLTVANDFQGWIRLGTPRYINPSMNWKSNLLAFFCLSLRKRSRFQSPDSFWNLPPDVSPPMPMQGVHEWKINFK